jgi:hypothetical protein
MKPDVTACNFIYIYIYIYKAETGVGAAIAAGNQEENEI